MYRYLIDNPGSWGEQQASAYLQEHGYKIVAQNYKGHYGEIDIIAKLDSQIIFVEVKTRLSKDYGRAAEFVNYPKQRRLILTAEEYISKNNLQNYNYAFNIIEIYYTITDDGHCSLQNIEHLTNAFEVGGMSL